MSRKRNLLNSLVPRIAYTTSKGIQWHEVTWYSKMAAIIVCFGILPAFCFYIGTQYQQTTDAIALPNATVDYNN